jgi:hypothetical protein
MPRRASSPLPPVGISKKIPFMKQKQVLNRHLSYQCFDLALPSLENSER